MSRKLASLLLPPDSTAERRNLGRVVKAKRLTVDDEGSNSDLGSDIHELGHKTEDGVLALPERAIVGESSGGLHVVHGLLRNLGHRSEEEQDDDGGSKAGDGEVDVL